MLLASIPPKIPLPWAASAGPSYVTYPTPTPSQIGTTNGAASFTDGFPPSNFVPYASGGAGPFGKDFNGLLKQITADLQWQQAGGQWPYDSSFQTEIGGYPNEAIVPSVAFPNVYWQSQVDNNLSDPDTGGANWIKIGPAGALCNVQVFTTSGTYTPTPGARSAIIEGTPAGGQGGGSAACSGSQGSAGAGGGSGGYAKVRIGPLSSQTVTIAAGGSGAGAGANGNAGGSSSIGSWLTLPGGFGGAAGGATAGPSITAVGGAGAVPTAGGGATLIWATAGATGLNGFVLPGGTIAVQSGAGGNSLMGGGGNNTNGVPSGNNGNNGVGYGAGGSGAASQPSTGPFAGGDGSNAIIIVWEFF